jgi:hypothetical protein
MDLVEKQNGADASFPESAPSILDDRSDIFYGGRDGGQRHEFFFSVIGN